MADTWVAFTANDLASSLAAGELAAYGQIDPASPEDDRTEQITTDLVAEIRGLIRSVSGNALSADASLIPPEFKARAIAVGRWRLLGALPGYESDEVRKLEYERADAFFAKVAEGKIRPQAPDDTPPAVPSVGASGSWNSENRIVGRMNPTPRPGQQNGNSRDDYANPEGPTDHG